MMHQPTENDMCTYLKTDSDHNTHQHINQQCISFDTSVDSDGSDLYCSTSSPREIASSESAWSRSINNITAQSLPEYLQVLDNGANHQSVNDEAHHQPVNAFSLYAAT
jgi:hypothetical protein